MRKLTGKNILVTGGAGFIGSNLVDDIVAENPGSVVVVDNFFLGKEENLKLAKKIFPKLKIYNAREYITESRLWGYFLTY